MSFNPLLRSMATRTDSYKVSHWLQYPPGTTRIYSYFESRGGRFPFSVMFGLQYYLKKYLSQPVSHEQVDLADKWWKKHFFGMDIFNTKGWHNLVDLHGGLLPVVVRALPEGAVSPTRTPLITIENTHNDFPWITNWVETMLVKCWYPISVASQSYAMRQILKQWLLETSDLEGDALEAKLDFMLHDFGYRGVSSEESAEIGAAAHLTSFKGSDTAIGIMMAEEFYNADMPGFSIPASEHSTITSWGPDGELAAFKNLLKQFPKGLVACVSDSWDIFQACRKYWGEELKDEVMKREGTLVVRPDSGDATKVVPDSLKELGLYYAPTKNNKGFDVLPPQIRLIQGDGVQYDSINGICKSVGNSGWSVENLAFGSGGALLQKLNRDTLEMAFKASHGTVDGQGRDIWKQPVTSKMKMSKRGRFDVDLVEGKHITLPEGKAIDNQLKVVFENGKLMVDHNFEDIRSRIRNSSVPKNIPLVKDREPQLVS